MSTHILPEAFTQPQHCSQPPKEVQLEAALAGGRPAEPRADLKQRSLLVRFGQRGIEQLVADHLDHGLTYTEMAKKYDVALSTVGKYIQQAKHQRAKAPANSIKNQPPFGTTTNTRLSN